MAGPAATRSGEQANRVRSAGGSAATTRYGATYGAPSPARTAHPPSAARETVLLGKTEALRETFQAALALGNFQAAELASALSITLQNISNRLKRLVEAGAVQRRQVPVSNRGGKEFVYTVTSLAIS